MDHVHKQNMRGNNDSARWDGLPNIAQPDIEPGITEEDLADHIELEDMQTTPVDKGKAREKPSDPDTESSARKDQIPDWGWIAKFNCVGIR